MNVTDAKGVSALINLASLHSLAFLPKRFSTNFHQPRPLGLSGEKIKQLCADVLVCVKLLLKAGACVNSVLHSGGNALSALQFWI